jgi:general secretion pathway protein I
MTTAHRPGGLRSARAGRTGWRRNGPRTGGFTLIEVLVAVAVVAVALGAGLKAAGALTDNTQRLIDVSAAHWCADNYLTGLRLTRQFPGIGDGEFACPQLGREYRGTLEVRPTPNPNFRRVDARIADERGQPLLTLSTVLPRY